MLKLLFWIYVIIISYLSFIPHSPPSIHYIDKIKHCLAFIVFAFLIQKSYKINNLFTMVYVVLFGVFGVFDVLADVTGGLIFILFSQKI